MQLLPADRLPIVAAPPVVSADEVRLALGLVDVRNQPLFKAAAAKKQLAAGVLASWRAWQWAPGGTPVGKLVVYTDGSAALSPGWPRAVRTAGWAAVCLCSDPAAEGNLLLLGVAFAPVLVGVHVPGSFGLLRPSAPAAELTAVAAVLALLRTRLQHSVASVSIASDCEYAVRVPQLRARSSTNHLLVRTARAEYAARSSCLETCLWHVRGHSGDPGNEMADVAADLGCAGELSHHGLLDRLRALQLPEGVERHRLPLHSLLFWGAVLEADGGGRTSPCGGAEAPAGEGAAEQAAEEAPRIVRMATANVLTLRPGEERVSIEGSARRIMLEEQFGDAGIHFVGVQEARSPHSEVRKGRRFTRVAAAADPGGSGGVELWINPDLRVDLDSVFVLHSSPRLLVVSLVWESQLACFAVLHAPDLAYGQFLADLDLAVPATFSTEGEGWTWQSNCGRRHRIDYVMCPVSWLAAVVRAEVPESVSIALEDRLDHRLAWVDFAVEVRPAKAALPPCTAADFMRHINRRALRLPAVAEELQLKWSSVPSLPPGWPADLCEQAVGSLARRFMLEVCPKERPAPTKDWISDGTWDLLRRHAAARRAFFDCGRNRRHLASHFWFRQWRAAATDREPLRRQLREAAALGSELEADAAARQALAGGCLQRASAAAATAVKRDRLEWLRSRADFIASQAAAGRQAPLWELVRQLAGRKAARGLRPVAVQRTADGTIISRREVLLACWEQLFSAEFGGFTRTFDFDQAREEVSKIIQDFILVDSQASEFEWVCSLVDALASCKLGRAVGPDAVPVEFMRASGMFFVKLVAQMCKAAAATGIPFTWRGGMMAAVPRKVQKPLTLANARGVLCSSNVGKLYGKCLRKVAVPALVAESMGAQYGAIPGGGTDLPSVAIQIFLDGAARRGRTVAVLFTDIKGAFYRCLPEIALGPLLPEGERLELFRKLGISPAAGQALHERIVAGSTALAKHEVPTGWRSHWRTGTEDLGSWCEGVAGAFCLRWGFGPAILPQMSSSLWPLMPSSSSSTRSWRSAVCSPPFQLLGRAFSAARGPTRPQSRLGSRRTWTTPPCPSRPPVPRTFSTCSPMPPMPSFVSPGRSAWSSTSPQARRRR